MYNPTMGVWLQRDPAQQGLDWYEYCGNDPVNRVDPTGLGKTETLAKGLKAYLEWFPHLYSGEIKIYVESLGVQRGELLRLSFKAVFSGANTIGRWEVVLTHGGKPLRGITVALMERMKANLVKYLAVVTERSGMAITRQVLLTAAEDVARKCGQEQGRVLAATIVEAVPEVTEGFTSKALKTVCVGGKWFIRGVSVVAVFAASKAFAVVAGVLETDSSRALGDNADMGYREAFEIPIEGLEISVEDLASLQEARKAVEAEIAQESAQKNIEPSQPGQPRQPEPLPANEYEINRLKSWLGQGKMPPLE